MTNLDYEGITKGLTTKSEKIRVLGRKGVPTADIARFLGIRYQHARNVLIDAGLQHGGMAEEMPVLETKMMPQPALKAPDRTAVWVSVGEGGVLTLPADLLAKAGIETDDRVFVGLTSEGLELVTKDAARERLRKIMAPFKQEGVSLVDEFLKERRAMWGEA
jgi:bifunctional DNA-binding transcriptional regulator/antitoxin component of YhaV-PrlF toxin-antitoxin module